MDKEGIDLFILEELNIPFPTITKPCLLLFRVREIGETDKSTPFTSVILTEVQQFDLLGYNLYKIYYLTLS